MRHGAALALADVETVAFGDDAAEDTDVKFFGNDIVDRDNKMIEGFERWPCRLSNAGTVAELSRLQLLHKPVRYVGSAVESFLPVADPSRSSSGRGVHRVVIKIERAARIHDAIVDAVAD